ncbi:MAG: mannose-1-phosphate guanylyltransferase/mannose-6-phosphate isomerase [Hyphomicrobium sp.]|nr:mannose-1-phosphate guanylyltransferase/mannose-6-phosphate isomerase [Hyphomicrobium sp.]
MTKVVPVILSGGSGTRLWPLSRALYPKQFIRFRPSQLKSFLGSALGRLPEHEGFAPPIILCNADHRFLVRAEADAAGVEPRAVILEPVARNTAPAIAVAALQARRDDPSAIIVVMPSDHVIPDGAAFIRAVKVATELAAKERLVLFGIRPDHPHTGYGYIERGPPIEEWSPAFEVARFTEKPDKVTAEAFLETDNYFWNSGIFVLHAQTFLDELARLAPNILAASERALAGAVSDLGFLRLEKSAFETSPSLSVDHAVMEHTTTAVVLPLAVGWNDVGSWTSLWEISEKDRMGNAITGDAVLDDTQGCYVHSQKRLVAAIGVKDLVIVETPDALLVADKARAQDVGKVVQRLKLLGRTEQEQHLRNHRPWGFFETLSIGPRFQVKLLHVKPGARLSLQMHHHRSEHWIVVQGTAKVTIEDRVQLVRENESVYITATQWHRLENPGKVPVELIEVQIGTYLGEDDIVRSDDDYRRAPEETR